MNKLSSKYCKTAGSLMIVGSIIFFVISGYLYMKPYKTVDYSAVKRAAFQACEVAAKSVEINVTKKFADGEIHLNTSGVEQWQKDLGNSSYVMKSCGGFKLVEYCYGSCKPKKAKNEIVGLSMKLKYISPKNSK